MKGDPYGTMSGSFFNNSLINILKYAKAIPVVHAELYSLYALDLATGPGTMCHGQLAHVDRKEYMLLYFFQCLDNIANWNQKNPSSDSMF